MRFETGESRSRPGIAPLSIMNSVRMRLANSLLLIFAAATVIFILQSSTPADSGIARSRNRQRVSEAPATSQITILSTTDLHGNIYPIDYNTNQKDRRGLARVSTIVKQIRKE